MPRVRFPDAADARRVDWVEKTGLPPVDPPERRAGTPLAMTQSAADERGRPNGKRTERAMNKLKRILPGLAARRIARPSKDRRNALTAHS